MIETEYLEPFGYVERDSDGRFVVFRWTDYAAIRAEYRGDVWLSLSNRKTICPHCAHVWEPRVPDPLSCPACRCYLHKKREPRGEVEAVSDREWRAARYL